MESYYNEMVADYKEYETEKHSNGSFFFLI